jgi:hypothetical protein
VSCLAKALTFNSMGRSSGEIACAFQRSGNGAMLSSVRNRTVNGAALKGGLGNKALGRVIRLFIDVVCKW